MTSRTLTSKRLVFPALLLVVGGCWQIATGVAAVARGGYFTAPPGYAFAFSIAAWGWVHLVVGVFAAAVGIGLFSGRPLARLLGVVVVSASLIANFLWLPIEPAWSAAVVGLDVLALWALATAAGRVPPARAGTADGGASRA
ncbi:hypothetical protein LO763_27415 [Glycomyces sp. A-F 0318]|uniref:DUF7144 family membrane protein n=1 Tax=Glycomyces amatae TaxID=2881355 RepID=UPI001E4CCE4C|nr:hypothetical protein [Glycomyces amatae]MCD0447351.1 hypothetical protein [Glycomyces amatae]